MLSKTTGLLATAVEVLEVTSLLCFEKFELNCDTVQLRYDGASVRVEATVLRLLEVLLRNAGRVVLKQELLEAVWGKNPVSENSLAVAMARLRRTLDEHGGARNSVVTVRGRGYRFLPPVVERESPETQSLAFPQPGNASFVGREHVMKQLARALLDTRSGSGSMVALRGEFGIGKTLVAERFSDEAVRQGCVVAWCYCRGQGDTPALWPFVELLRGVLGPGAAAEGVNHTLATRLAELSSYFPVHSSGRDACIPHPKLEARYHMFDVVARALEQAAQSTPHVLIFDDLQCADETSLQLVHYLLASIRRTRLLLVATAPHVASSEQPCETRLAAVLGHRNCLRIALEPLERADVASYVEQRCGDSARWSQRLYEISEGNPFYLSELVRQLQDRGPTATSRVMPPRIVFELIGRRISLLNPETIEVLTCAAVIGRSFGLPLLAAATQRRPAALMAALDNACAHAVIRRVAHFGLEYTFSHGLLRLALYERQSPADRRARHLRVAQALERRAALAEFPCTELADQALAALPDGDLGKTVEHCMKATDVSADRCAFADAIRYIECARATLKLCDGVDPALRFQLLLRHAFLVRVHRSREFQPLADQLLRLGRDQGGAALAAASLLLDPLPGLPSAFAARSVLVQALAALGEDNPALRPALMARLATCGPLAYVAQQSYAQLERALASAATSPARVDRFSARFGELYLYGGPVHRPRAAMAIIELERLCNERTPHAPLAAVWLELHRSLTSLQLGDVASALRALDRWEVHLSDLDVDSDGEMQWYLERLRALVQINLGNEAEGSAGLAGLYQSLQARSARPDVAFFFSYDRSVLRHGAELSSAAPPALAPDPSDTPNIWALKVRALQASGCLDEARSALQLVPAERLAQLPCDREYLGTLGALARAALALHTTAYMRSIYECLRPFARWFAVNISGFCEGSISLLLGLLSLRLGEAQRALQHFEAAVQYSERAGYAASLAEARRERSRLECSTRVSAS